MVNEYVTVEMGENPVCLVVEIQSSGEKVLLLFLLYYMHSLCRSPGYGSTL